MGEQGKGGRFVRYRLILGVMGSVWACSDLITCHVIVCVLIVADAPKAVIRGWHGDDKGRYFMTGKGVDGGWHGMMGLKRWLMR